MLEEGWTTDKILCCHWKDLRCGFKMCHMSVCAVERKHAGRRRGIASTQRLTYRFYSEILIKKVTPAQWHMQLRRQGAGRRNGPKTEGYLRKHDGSIVTETE